MTTTLVLGAAHQDRSTYAAGLCGAVPPVRYRVTGPGPSDTSADTRRPIPADQLAQSLIGSRHPVVIETVTDWVWQLLEQHDLWSDPTGAIQALDPVLDEVLVAYSSLPHDVVAVSEEVGWVAAPPTGHEQTHREVLTHVNHRFSAHSDRVHLIIGGRMVDLSQTPSILQLTAPPFPASS